MRYLKLTSHIASLLVVIMLSACASVATKSFKEAEKLESEGKYEEAMYSYGESFKSDPTLNESRIRFFNTRQKAADQRYRQGMALIVKGNYVDALPEFQAAQGIDPTQDRFSQQIEVSTRYRNAQAAFQVQIVFAGLLVLAFLGIVLYAATAIIEQRFTGWAFRGQNR